MKQTKKQCPYCGRLIKASARTCSAHSDLLRLDEEQTGWRAK